MLTMADIDPRSDVGGPKTITRDLRWPGPAVSPGEMLSEEFLQPLGISPVEAARRMEISAHRLNEIVGDQVPVTMDTAWRLSRLLKTSPQFWMRLQADWDLLSRGPRLEIGRRRPTRTEQTPLLPDMSMHGVGK